MSAMFGLSGAFMYPSGPIVDKHGRQYNNTVKVYNISDCQETGFRTLVGVLLFWGV